MGSSLGNRCRHQPPESFIFYRRLKLQSYIEQSLLLPPLAKPPPQPPDPPPYLSRLEFNSTGSAVFSPSRPTSLRVSSKADAAGDDPGDIQFVHHNLEGKAVFKGLAGAWIFPMVESYVEGLGFVLQPPSEPPPWPSVTVLECTYLVLVTGDGHKNEAVAASGTWLLKWRSAMFYSGDIQEGNKTLSEKKLKVEAKSVTRMLRLLCVY